MRRASAGIVAAACAMGLGAGGCAHATRPVVLERPPAASVSRLSDLPSMPGAHVVVLLRNGESARGAVETIDGQVLVLRVSEDSLTPRRVSEQRHRVSGPARREIDDGSARSTNPESVRRGAERAAIAAGIIISPTMLMASLARS